MDPLGVYQALLDAGVVEERGDSVELTDSFAAAVEERRLDADRAEGPNGDSTFEDDRLSAVASAIDEFIDLDDGQNARILPTLVSIHHPPERSEGAPDGFLPLRGEFLRPIVTAFPAAIVYVWRDDCDPCDVMSARLGDVADSAPEGLLLISVYGPSNARRLYEEFRVRGAPTTLFVKRGDVDSRLLGSKPASTLETELGMIRSAIPIE